MNQEDLDRFHELSEKLLNGTETEQELFEYLRLLKVWNASTELESLKKT